ncbi:MAG: peptidyl-prolyl cis-trans isomerase [Verrucomicrobia bacterium]|nr:peptidyl-prolyl cis-trans isomerase [Verrucomicrobiota bacterium]MBS0646089.1 peptidyl-prolyl cis-trans isomerase [Verrucomicrobiota bacterium]
MFKPLLAFCLASTSLIALPSSDFPVNGYPDRLEVNNRVLIKVNGVPISIIDVVRKMDLVFFQQYPQFANQTPLRYQFYQENWRNFLQVAIDDQLILADAKEKKIEVSDGEIREHLEQSLGPDIVFSIESLGLTFDEAWDLVKTDLTVQRMKGMMVHARAFADLQPKAVRARYEKMLVDHPPECHWLYKVISFKADNEEASLQVAQRAHQLLTQQRVALEVLGQNLTDTALSISDSYSRSAKEISQAHRSVLEGMKQGNYSEPVLRKGVAYIFYLEEFKNAQPPSFAQSASEIKKELLQEYFVRYDHEYKERLRKRYGLTEQFIGQLIPEQTQPFALR